MSFTFPQTIAQRQQRAQAAYGSPYGRIASPNPAYHSQFSVPTSQASNSPQSYTPIPPPRSRATPLQSTPDNSLFYQLQAASHNGPAAIIHPASPASRSSHPPPLASQNVTQDSSVVSRPHTKLSNYVNTVNHNTSSATRAPPDSPSLLTSISDMGPPPEGIHPTFDALLAAANAHAFTRGYAFVIARSKKKGLAGLKKILLACDRWGPAHSSSSRPAEQRKRTTTSKKTDCKFGVFAIESATEWRLQWRPDAGCNVHNHAPTEDMSTHAAARKLNPQALAAVKHYSALGLSVKETVEQILAAQPGSMVIARDVYNARALMKREPQKFSEVEPEAVLEVVERAKKSPEEKMRDECRLEVQRAKDETEAVKRELEELKRVVREKDRMIEKFEMFIDICNQRVMVQRDRLNDAGSGVEQGTGGGRGSGAGSAGTA